jgi:hypothetical protein
VLAGADKSVDDISKKVVGTSGPNTSVIAPGETPLVKKALEKPPTIPNHQGKKLAENKISTPRVADKKCDEKPSAISKLQEYNLVKNVWPPKNELSNGLQQLPMQLSDLYDLFNLDALDLTLLCYFLL